MEVTYSYMGSFLWVLFFCSCLPIFLLLLRKTIRWKTFLPQNPPKTDKKNNQYSQAFSELIHYFGILKIMLRPDILCILKKQLYYKPDTKN